MEIQRTWNDKNQLYKKQMHIRGLIWWTFLIPRKAPAIKAMFPNQRESTELDVSMLQGQQRASPVSCSATALQGKESTVSIMQQPPHLTPWKLSEQYLKIQIGTLVSVRNRIGPMLRSRVITDSWVLFVIRGKTSKMTNEKLYSTTLIK